MNWHAEDGGPERLQQVPGRLLGNHEGADASQAPRLQVHARRTWLSTMVVRGAPGEVYLLTHSALRGRLGLATTAQVERIDPAHHVLHLALPSPGSDQQLHELIADLQLHVRGKLAPSEYPKEIEFIDALPMTTTGKVQRRVLRDLEASRAVAP